MRELLSYLNTSESRDFTRKYFFCCCFFFFDNLLCPPFLSGASDQPLSCVDWDILTGVWAPACQETVTAPWCPPPHQHDQISRGTLSRLRGVAGRECLLFFGKSPVQALQMAPRVMPSLSRAGKFFLVTPMSPHLLLPHLCFHHPPCCPRITSRCLPFSLGWPCPLHLPSSKTGMLPNEFFPHYSLNDDSCSSIRALREFVFNQHIMEIKVSSPKE